MAAKSPSDTTHTCLDCFVVPVLCKHKRRVDADVARLNNCSRCMNQGESDPSFTQQNLWSADIARAASLDTTASDHIDLQLCKERQRA